MIGPLGIACHWANDAPSTWSGTPWHLREELRTRTEVVDVGFQLPAWQQFALKAASTRRSGGRFVTRWRHSRGVEVLGRRALERGVRRSDVAAVLEFQDLAVLDVPYLVVQDLSYDLLLEHWTQGGVPHFPGLTRDDILRRRDRQLELYERAAVLLPMSRWLASSIVRSGTDERKVRVVNPGASSVQAAPAIVPERRVPRGRLLIVGRDFHTKAGDEVVAAFQLLRAHGEDVTLTVAGPRSWPLPGPVPDGVTFLGPVSRERVATLFDEHDLFVMPSRFEGFGMVFAEALARGLPCIGRDACAMPEIIEDGVTGALVSGDDPQELADTIARVLGDDDIYRNCAARAGSTREWYSWGRAADEVLEVVRGL